jgi:hypothetical protein
MVLFLVFSIAGDCKKGRPKTGSLGATFEEEMPHPGGEQVIGSCQRPGANEPKTFPGYVMDNHKRPSHDWILPGNDPHRMIRQIAHLRRDDP